VTAGPFWRSHPRYAMTEPGLPAMLYWQYSNNHLYVYPADRDYRAQFGDLMPGNVPYLIISDGKSGSDQPFLYAVANILAAFKPSVKEFLVSKHILMPTVQMIFRRGQKGVDSDNDYLGWRAHPAVFSAANMDVMKMIRLANKLEVEDIPPLVHISVIEESSPKAGIDDFMAGMSETLFDTPAAISRVVRASAYEKNMVVKAAPALLADSKQFSYHWVVLRGDAKRIRITPRNEKASEVEIAVPWHGRFPSPERPDITTDRVEIGVFINNGRQYSAPSFVTFTYPADQKREYDNRNRIVRLDHSHPVNTKRYVDPMLFPRRDWADIYQYDDQDRLVGWRRVRGGGREEQFSRNGSRVLEVDRLGRPVKAEAIHYILKPLRNGRSDVAQEASRKLTYFHYDSDDDQYGDPR